MKNRNPWIHYGILAFIYLVGGITLITHTIFHSLIHGGADIVYAYQKCEKIGQTQIILIEHNSFIPDKAIVNRCDVVIFKNEDRNALYLPALGEHPHHIQYAGFTEKVIGYQQANSFIAHSAGTFLFHDHLKDQAEGTLIVK